MNLDDLGIVFLGSSKTTIDEKSDHKKLLYNGKLIDASFNDLKDSLKNRWENEPFLTLDIKLDNNANPYVRTTQRAKFVSKSYKKYKEWKEFLQDEFLKQVKRPHTKVFKPKCPYFIEICLVHKNLTFGDGDNILKGVNDSLFENDKYNSGAVYFGVERGDKARIVIAFYKEKE